PVDLGFSHLRFSRGLGLDRGGYRVRGRALPHARRLGNARLDLRGLLERAAGLADALHPVEVERRGAVDFEMPELEAVDVVEAELPDTADEGVGEALDDEQDARRARRRDLRRRIQPPDRVRVLETPGVRVHPTQQQPLVGREIERDQHERALRVQADQVDRSLAQEEVPVDHLEPELDALDVLGDERRQLLELRDFQSPERGAHRLHLVPDDIGVAGLAESPPRGTMTQPTARRSPSMVWAERRLSWCRSAPSGPEGSCRSTARRSRRTRTVWFPANARFRSS